MARTLTKKITRSLLHFLYLPSPYDREQERIEAERFLRQQIDERANEGHTHEQDGAFQYAANTGFDPQP